MDIALKVREAGAEELLFLGLCLTFFLIPLGTTPFLVAGFLSLLVWVASGGFLRDWRPLLGQRWALPVLLGVFLHWAGLLYTNDFASGLKFALKTHYWLFAFALASAPFHRYPARALFNSFLAGLSIAALVHISASTGMAHLPDKYHSGFINPITYILLLTFGIVLLSRYFGQTRDLKARLLYGALMLLFCASLSLFSGAPGRTALLSFIVMTPLVVYNCVGRRLKAALPAIAIAAGALLLLPVVQTSLADGASQAASYFSGSPNTSVGLRLHMWSGAVSIFLQNPLFGVGTGGYGMEMMKYANSQLDPSIRFIQPHNSFLYMAASFGIPGLLALSWLFFELFREAWKKRRSLPGFAALSFSIVMAVASLTDTQIMQVHSGMLFAMLTGLLAASKPEGEEGREID